MHRTGVFGSAFDPPTRGHLDVLHQVAHEFDTILLVPSAAHAFSKKSLPLEVRTELLEAFCRDISKLPCTVEICLLEADLLLQAPHKPVYTYDLLKALNQKYPDHEICFIRGPDNAKKETWQRFYRFQEIEQGWPIVTVREKLPIRSSLLRELIINNQNQSFQDELAKLVTPSVQALIVEKNLYQAKP